MGFRYFFFLDETEVQIPGHKKGNFYLTRLGRRVEKNPTVSSKE